MVEAGAKVHHNVTWHGFPAPVLTFKILGRLGNTMGVYASLWALGRIYDVSPDEYNVSHWDLNMLSKVFMHFDIFFRWGK